MAGIQSNRLYQFLIRIKVFAVIFVAVCAAFDFFAIHELFINLRAEGNEPIIYAIVLAVFLEGIPVVIGKALYEVYDKSKYEKNSSYVAWISLIVGFIAFLCAFIIYFYLRSEWINEVGGKKGFEVLKRRETDPNQYYLEVFRLFSPFVTSLGAFTLSFFPFRESSCDSLNKEVNKLNAYYIRKVKKYMRLKNRYRDACDDLWTNLANNQFDERPETYGEFREECMIRIRDKLAKNCLDEYNAQIERYSLEIEKDLRKCITYLSEHSTLPYAISSMPVTELLREYDEKARDPAEMWDYNVAGVELKKDLAKSLDSAISAARLHVDN